MSNKYEYIHIIKVYYKEIKIMDNSLMNFIIHNKSVIKHIKINASSYKQYDLQEILKLYLFY
jgi:hypothetical protein